LKEQNKDQAMKNQEKTHMSTLSGCINKLQASGFAENFLISEECLCIKSHERTYRPQEVKISNFYRFEGESDPSDNAILYAIETIDGKKGMLIDAYGAYSDGHISKFIQEVENISKKAATNG
jgi:hypothetical protein